VLLLLPRDVQRSLARLRIVVVVGLGVIGPVLDLFGGQGRQGEGGEGGRGRRRHPGQVVKMVGNGCKLMLLVLLWVCVVVFRVVVFEW